MPLFDPSFVQQENLTDSERSRLEAEVLRSLRKLRHGTKDNFEGLPSPLTLRERDVLIQLMQGRSNREAALALGISPRTVEVHRRRIMQKFGARNVVELALLVRDAWAKANYVP